MEDVYLISLLVGGFFVLLSIFGGLGSGADFDADADLDFDADADTDVDAGTDMGAGPGFVDLFTLRALFLFAAFFGLTGTLLTWTGSGGLATLLASVVMGFVIGLGGNYAIKRVGHETVSSSIERGDLHGRTAHVLIPFTGPDLGKIRLDTKGQRLQLRARAFEGVEEPFEPGDQVVVIRTAKGVAEVVKPE